MSQHRCALTTKLPLERLCSSLTPCTSRLRTSRAQSKRSSDRMTPGYVRGKANQVLGESAYLRKVTLSTLRGVVARIAEMPGQRMIALFSEGFTLSDSAGGYETADLQSVTSRAARSGVIIYSIAAQGLQVNMVPASLPGIAEGRQGFRGLRGSGIARPVLTDYMAAAERDLQDGLNALARDTGGDAFFNTNDFNGRLQKALDDNRIYYTLAYYPPLPPSGSPLPLSPLRPCQNLLQQSKCRTTSPTLANATETVQ